MTTPATGRPRRARGRALELASALGLLPACRGEFVIGVIEGAGSGSAGSTSAVTLDTGSTTASTATSASTSGGIDGSSGSGSGSGSGSSSGSSDSTTGPPLVCEAPPGHTVCDADGDPFHALGLDCPGGKFDTQPLVQPGTLVSSDPDAWAVIRELGNRTWRPDEGTYMLALSTGNLPPADGSGRVEIPLGVTDATDGSNDNPDGVALPAPILPQAGSAGGVGGQPFMNCDGVGDCSDTLPTPWQAGGPARDLAWLTFDIDVPPGTLGYQVDLAWFSTELPARYQTVGTDVIVWWQSSEAFTGNMATLEGAPLSANGVAGWVAVQGLLGNDTELFGTGFDGTTGLPCDLPGAAYLDCPRGAATGWLTLTGPSEPEERMTIAVALFDLLDDDRDTVVLLDDWHWYCPGCTPGADCGLAPR